MLLYNHRKGKEKNKETKKGKVKKMMYVGKKVEEVMAELKEENVKFVCEFNETNTYGLVHIGEYWLDHEVLDVEEEIVVDEWYDEWE